MLCFSPISLTGRSILSSVDYRYLMLILSLDICRLFLMKSLGLCTLLPFLSARQHPSSGDCLEVKREYYQNCSVLDCVTWCGNMQVMVNWEFYYVRARTWITLTVQVTHSCRISLTLSTSVATSCAGSPLTGTVTCEIKLFQKHFSLRRRLSEIILFQWMETCLKLFCMLIAAHEYFPACWLSLK